MLKWRFGSDILLKNQYFKLSRWQSQIDKTVHDYLVGVQSDLNSEEEIKQNLQWTQDFVSMVLSSIGSQVVNIYSVHQLELFCLSTLMLLPVARTNTII